MKSKVHKFNRKVNIKAFIDESPGVNEIYIFSSGMNIDKKIHGNSILLDGEIRLKGVVLIGDAHENSREIMLSFPVDESISILEGEKDRGGTQQKGRGQPEEEGKLEEAPQNIPEGMCITFHIEDLMISPLGRERIECDLVLEVAVKYSEEEMLEVIENVELGEEITSGACDSDANTTFRIYYPTAGDTLWNICRKFRIKKDALLQMNEDVDFNSLQQGEMLIVP